MEKGIHEELPVCGDKAAQAAVALKRAEKRREERESGVRPA